MWKAQKSLSDRLYWAFHKSPPPPGRLAGIKKQILFSGKRIPKIQRKKWTDAYIIGI
jgi:hypothetical protein